LPRQTHQLHTPERRVGASLHLMEVLQELNGLGVFAPSWERQEQSGEDQRRSGDKGRAISVQPRGEDHDSRTTSADPVKLMSRMVPRRAEACQRLVAPHG
jgi:hypothetical protein